MSLPIKRGGQPMPNRVLYYGSPGTAKSTFGAYATRPLFLLTPGETGLLTLVSYGRAPECDYLEPRSWGEAMNYLAEIARTPSDHRTIVVDTVNGLEAMCHESVAASKFGGSMQKYLDFDKGPAGAVVEWRRLFAGLDLIRQTRNVGIILLAHSAAKRIKSPDSDDYDMTLPLIHDKFRPALMQWADITVFARRVVGTRKEGLRTKADYLGDLQLITTEGATHEAKNRVGLPPTLDIPPDDPPAVFGTFAAAMRAAREKGKKPEAQPKADGSHVNANGQAPAEEAVAA